MVTAEVWPGVQATEMVTKHQILTGLDGILLDLGYPQCLPLLIRTQASDHIRL